MARVNIPQKGDTIGIAAPSSHFDKEMFKQGVAILKQCGFHSYYREDIFDQNRYFAGDDKRRANELNELFLNKDVKAILFARGGYGSQRILHLLDLSSIKKKPKPVVGFSDTTSLISFLRQEVNIPTLYGPSVLQIGSGLTFGAIKSFVSALTGHGPIGKTISKTAQTLKTGEAGGVLVGGCLSLINHGIGTAYELNTKNTILFFEDINEKVYELDRMLIQLKHAGKMSKVKGIIIGSMILDQNEKYDFKEMILDIFNDFDGPIINDFAVGHFDNTQTLPFGVKVVLKADKNTEPIIDFKTSLYE